jgi:hypothetical protein
MESHDQKKGDALLPYEELLTAGKFKGQPPTAEVLLAIERHRLKSKSQSACRYDSEEAIPERDPSYRLPDGTGCDEPTVEALSAEVRLDLAHRLQKLGMSRARAAVVASL